MYATPLSANFQAPVPEVGNLEGRQTKTIHMYMGDKREEEKRKNQQKTKEKKKRKAYCHPGNDISYPKQGKQPTPPREQFTPPISHRCHAQNTHRRCELGRRTRRSPASKMCCLHKPAGFWPIPCQSDGGRASGRTYDRHRRMHTRRGCCAV